VNEPRTQRAVGWVVLGVALVGIAAGLASLALDQGLGMITADTSADMVLVSLGVAAVAVLIGFALRRYARRARDGMFVGLATLGGWFLLLVYALSQDTP
jgi:hypothetical protein